MSATAYNACNSELAKTAQLTGATKTPNIVYVGGYDTPDIKSNPCNLTRGIPVAYNWGKCPAGYSEDDTQQQGHRCHRSYSHMGNFDYACGKDVTHKNYSYKACQNKASNVKGQCNLNSGPGKCYKRCKLLENPSGDSTVSPLFHEISEKLKSNSDSSDLRNKIQEAVKCCTGVYQTFGEIANSKCGNLIQLNKPPTGFAGGITKCVDETNECGRIMDNYCFNKDNATEFKSPNGECYKYFYGDPSGNAPKTKLKNFCKDKAPHILKNGKKDDGGKTPENYHYVNKTLTNMKDTDAKEYIQNYKDTCACFYDENFYKAYNEKVRSSYPGFSIIGDVGVRPDCLYPECANAWAQPGGGTVKGPKNKKQACPANCNVTCIQNSNFSVSGSISGDIQVPVNQKNNCACFMAGNISGGSSVTSSGTSSTSTKHTRKRDESKDESKKDESKKDESKDDGFPILKIAMIILAVIVAIVVIMAIV